MFFSGRHFLSKIEPGASRFVLLELRTGCHSLHANVTPFTLPLLDIAMLLLRGIVLLLKFFVITAVISSSSIRDGGVDDNDVVVSISLTDMEEQGCFQGNDICELRVAAAAIQEGPSRGIGRLIDNRRHLQPNDDGSSPEAFPIIFSATCLAIAVLFTILVAVRTTTNYNKNKDTSTKEDTTNKEHAPNSGTLPDESHAPNSGTLPDESLRAQMMKRSSWIGSYIYRESSRELTSGSSKGIPALRNSILDKLDEAQEEESGDDDDDDDGNDNEAKPKLSKKEALKLEKKKAKKEAKKAKKTETKKLNERVILSWRDLGCSYLSKTAGEPPIVTLHGATGALRTKELTAIMGGSGGGKSTLLDILSGRKSLGTLVGDMSILGQVVPIAEAGGILRDVAAYVPQNEMFFPTQTPEEAVAFFANLKLGRDRRGDAHRYESISGLLDQVGLSMTARTRPIGGGLAGGIAIRGLSGGERKRLALACAVAMRPNILFLDEITSGLDSENAVKVVRLLKRLCKNMDVAAAVVIHQPSGKVFELFDQLILLSMGRCIYSDQTSNIPDWYKRTLKCDLPPSHVLADDLLEKAMMWVPKEEKKKSKHNKLLPTKAVEPKVSSENYMGASTLFTFSCIFFRNLENHYVRNLTNLAARIFIYAMTAVLLGLIFWKVGGHDTETVTNADAQILLGAGLFLAQSSILLPFAQISTFFFDKKVFAAENALGLYAPWMYALSQFLLEAWVLVMSACVQASISIPMIGLWNPVWSRASSFFSMLSFFCISGLVGNSIILFISMVSFSQDFAFLLGSSYVTLCLAASGGFVPFDVMPSWLRWLQWISAIKYALQMFMLTAFSGTSVTLIEMLKLDTPDTISMNLVILLAMFACFASLSIVFLSIQKERR